MITSLSWYNNLLGSSLTLNDTIYPIREIQQSIDTKAEYVDKPYREGAYYAPSFMGQRRVTLEGAILANTSSELNDRRRALFKYFQSFSYASWNTMGILNCQFDNVPESVGLECDPLGAPECSIAALYSHAEFQINLVAPEPHWKGALDTYTQTTPGAGTVPIAGDVPTWPIITFTGPQTNTVFSSAGGLGPAVTFSGLTLTSGQTVVIDFLRHTMTGSISNAWDLVTSLSWRPMPPGSIGISWTASTSSAGRQCKIETNPNFMP